MKTALNITVITQNARFRKVKLDLKISCNLKVYTISKFLF